MTETLKAPFPYFGGKAAIAPEVWRRFGAVSNYVEPFCGSAAVLLSRPDTGWQEGTETVNDVDCHLVNFWRALANDPEGVGEWADYPVSELDLHARHRWLTTSEAAIAFRECMRADPDFYDVKMAGWWVWGISQWIGGGWCSESACYTKGLPHLGDAGKGVHRKGLKQQRPHLAYKGMGVHRKGLSQKLPHLGDAGTGVHRGSLAGGLSDYLCRLSARLRRVRICCGDWSRVLGPSVTVKRGLTAVFLDPPYSAEAGRAEKLYAHEDLSVAHAVREWAIANGENPLLRIALCGYDTEHEFPPGWIAWNWHAHGGYANRVEGAGKANKKREVVWFSPHCVKTGLFDGEES